MNIIVNKELTKKKTKLEVVVVFYTVITAQKRKFI